MQDSLNSFHVTEDTILSLASQLNAMSPIDLADLIERKPFDEKKLLFDSLSADKAAHVFEYLSFGNQKLLLSTLPSQRVADLLNKIAPDDRTSLLEELPEDIVNQLLKYLSPQERALSIKLLGYREDSVGRLMTPDFIAVKMDWQVKDVLDHIRKKGRDSETIMLSMPLMIKEY